MKGGHTCSPSATGQRYISCTGHNGNYQQLNSNSLLTLRTAMKVLIIFALFAASNAAVLLHHPAVIGTGGSSQYRSQDNHGNYNFGYDEGHLSGGTFRKESGDGHGNVAGSYGLRDADGRVRVVNYVADAAGFRADIQTNEPGVEPKDPANTAINKAGVVVAPYAAAPALAYAPAPVAYAPAPVAYATHHQVAHAPIAYGAHHLAAPHYGYSYHY